MTKSTARGLSKANEDSAQLCKFGIGVLWLDRLDRSAKWGGESMDAQGILDKISENLSVKRSFGKGYESEGALVIPVALVVGGGGGGAGPIATTSHDATAAASNEHSKSSHPEATPEFGGGGGFGGLVLPLGVYVVKGDQVRWVPALDVTRVALAALAVLRLFLRVVKINRRRRLG